MLDIDCIDLFVANLPDDVTENEETTEVSKGIKTITGDKESKSKETIDGE